MVRRSAWLVLSISLFTVGCELVVGGREHALIELPDADVQEGGGDDLPDAPAVPDAGPVTDAVALALDVTSRPSAEAGSPCAPPRSCVDAIASCAKKCQAEFTACMMMDQGGGGNGKHVDCAGQLTTCDSACRTQCLACIACPAAEAACAVP